MTLPVRVILSGSINPLSEKTTMLVIHNNQHSETLFKPQLMAKACTALIHPYTIPLLPVRRPQMVIGNVQEVIGKYAVQATYRVAVFRACT
jgi:hypothetical protein